MPRSSKPRRTLEDLEAAADVVRPVQDRLVYDIPLDQIRPAPRNPRQRVDGLDELGESLHEYGLLQPVVVRRVQADSYQLIAGHRRFAAAQQIGWTTIPAVVREETDDQAYLLTLTENLQREDLTPREEAAALEVLVRERGWSTRQVGEAVKRSHIYVSRRLRVFDDPVLAPLVLRNGLAVSTAEELLRAPGADAREQLAKEAAAAQWTPARARRAVREWNESFQRETPAPAPRLASRIRALTVELTNLDPALLSVATRHELVKLLEAARALAT